MVVPRSSASVVTRARNSTAPSGRFWNRLVEKEDRRIGDQGSGGTEPGAPMPASKPPNIRSPASASPTHRPREIRASAAGARRSRAGRQKLKGWRPVRRQYHDRSSPITSPRDRRTASRVGHHVVARDGGRAGKSGRTLEPRICQQRALARSVRPQERDDLPRKDGESTPQSAEDRSRSASKGGRLDRRTECLAKRNFAGDSDAPGPRWRSSLWRRRASPSRVTPAGGGVA